ncbi:MAG TPA: hypothetical protein VGM49_06460 [Candidatus Limnocylindrales bacterium]|jgi:hypothetical protein
MPPELLPLILIVHVVLAISLFVPSLLLPFAFRAGRGLLKPGKPGRIVRFLLALQSRGTVWIGGGLAISGIGLVATLGGGILDHGWLAVALGIYAVTLGVAYFIQVPRLRRLIGLRSGSDPRWPELARRQRYVSYVMAGLVGTIGFLMSTKPALW